MKRNRVIRFKTTYANSPFSKEISEFKLEDCTHKELMSSFKSYSNRFGGVFELVSHGAY